MDRENAIKRAGIITMVAFSILIIILGTEIFYFNLSNGFYIIAGVLILKFAAAWNMKRMIDKINRDYPKEENSN